MTVEILRLCGMQTAEAEQAANVLLDLQAGPRDLRNLLVLDDTALLMHHAPVYRRLDKAGRVEELLCVAIGRRAENDRALFLPGNLGGTQGSPVLWVSNPAGIDWRMAAAAIAIGHPPGKATGLDCLVELLTVDDMFKHVYKIFVEKVPGRVANPGLRLAGQDDEMATFAAAVGVAVRALCAPGSGADGPFLELLPSPRDIPTLTVDGRLARYRDEVARSARRKLTGFGSKLRRQAALQARFIEAGNALTDLRDLVAKLLRNAQTVGELTDNQRRLIAEAGVRFSPEEPHSSLTITSGAATEPSPVYRVVLKAIQGGDTLTLVARRLTLTERELKRRGSASYLQELDEHCPPWLIDRLVNPAKRFSRDGDPTAVRHDRSLDDAMSAARAIEDLVIAVANREWSRAGTSHNEVARIRVALDGVCRAMTEQAERGDGQERRPRGARLSRLGEALMPVLHDLVFRVLAAESTQPSTSGQEAFEAARGRTARLLIHWALHVHAEGVLSPPPFATSVVQDTAPYADEDDVAEIRAALLYQPDQEMWQLCAPEDLGMLNTAASLQVVRFASRLDKDALAGLVPGDQPVWTSSGSHAGLLRLVSLGPGSVSSSWNDPPSNAESSVTESSPARETP